MTNQNATESIIDTDNLLTRDEVVELLTDEGYDVSYRTIRYWESEGLLPSPIRSGRRVYYDDTSISKIRFLCATRISSFREMRQSVLRKEPFCKIGSISGFDTRIENRGDGIIILRVKVN